MDVDLPWEEEKTGNDSSSDSSSDSDSSVEMARIIREEKGKKEVWSASGDNDEIAWAE